MPPYRPPTRSAAGANLAAATTPSAASLPAANDAEGASGVKRTPNNRPGSNSGFYTPSRTAATRKGFKQVMPLASGSANVRTPKKRAAPVEEEEDDDDDDDKENVEPAPKRQKTLGGRKPVEGVSPTPTTRPNLKRTVRAAPKIEQEEDDDDDEGGAPVSESEVEDEDEEKVVFVGRGKGKVEQASRGDGPMLSSGLDEDDEYEESEDEEAEAEDDGEDEDLGVVLTALEGLVEEASGGLGGALAKLKPYKRSDHGTISNVRHPESFKSTSLGTPDAGFRGDESKRAKAIRTYELGMRHVIETAITQAHTVDSKGQLERESRLCPQSWKLLKKWDADAIWDLVKSATTEERQAVLGSGELSDELFDQLPRATLAELNGPLVYLDWIKFNIKRGGYTGSGTAEDGGIVRLGTYEKAKRYADRGLKQANTGGAHLDAALHEGATMDLRVVLTFTKGTSSDIVVLCEGLMTDYTRTIDAQAPMKRIFAITSHSPAIWQLCSAAQPPQRGEPATFTGLNRSSPLRQGSGKCGGSIWGWTYQDSALSEAERNKLLDAKKAELLARRCIACKTSETFHWCAPGPHLDKIPILPDDYVCHRCYKDLHSHKVKDFTAEGQEAWRAKMEAWGPPPKKNEKRCRGCKRKDSGAGHWNLGRTVVSKLIHLGLQVFCNPCYRRSREEGVANFSAKEQEAWVVKQGLPKPTEAEECRACKGAEPGSAWALGKSVVPKLTDLKSVRFCSYCYRRAKRENVKAMTAEQQAAWIVKQDKSGGEE